MVAGASAPAFLLALLGILLFYNRLHWLPATGDTSYTDAPTGPTGLLVDRHPRARPASHVVGRRRHLILPALCVAIWAPRCPSGGCFALSLVTNLGSDYVRTARAKGLDRAGRAVAARPAQLVDAALSMTGLQVGSDVRRRGGDRDRSSPGRASGCTPTRAFPPRTSRPSRASPSCWGSPTW